MKVAMSIFTVVAVAVIAAFVHGLGVPYVLPVAMWLLAVLTWVTVGQRIVHVRRQLRVAVPEEVRAAKRINAEGERIIEKAQEEALAAAVTKLSRSLPRMPAGPVAFTNVRLYDADASRFLNDQTVVVEKGVLKSYLCNHYAAKKLGLASTGSADGGGVGPANFYLEPGEGALAPADIVWTVPSLMASFKIARIGDPVGALRQEILCQAHTKLGCFLDGAADAGAMVRIAGEL